MSNWGEYVGIYVLFCFCKFVEKFKFVNFVKMLRLVFVRLVWIGVGGDDLFLFDVRDFVRFVGFLNLIERVN